MNNESYVPISSTKEYGCYVDRLLNIEEAIELSKELISKIYL